MIGKKFGFGGLAGAVLAFAATIAATPFEARAADHLDGPRLMANPAGLGNLDINDVYIFQGANPKNTVLIMTLSPAAGILGPASFSTIGAYEFKIVNDGSTAEHMTIRFNFGAPDGTGHQAYQFAAISAAGQVLLAGGGTTGRTTKLRDGVMARPDLYDDPFFFDLNAFNRFKARALAGDPNAASEFLARGVKNIPQNFFGGFNVMAIVVEVPSVLLQSSKADTKIGVWARTLLEIQGEVQFDRMARPAINTVLLPDGFKDTFNSAVPAQDTAFIPIATDELTKLFGNPAQAQAHATLLLPDIMTFDTSSRAGFLNGRQLPDDVIDAELSLLTGGAVTTDKVGNDSVFQPGFPYLGTPNPKTVTIVVKPGKGKRQKAASAGPANKHAAPKVQPRRKP